MKCVIVAIMSAVLFIGSYSGVHDLKVNNGPAINHAAIERMKQTECLAKNIYFEARNQSEKGMQAVAMVTLNRTKNPKFPSTICEVVYQGVGKNKCQFSWVCDDPEINDWDSYFRIMDLSEKILRDDKVVDNTNGSLYYHEKKTKPYWRSKFKVAAKIGDHVFYRI